MNAAMTRKNGTDKLVIVNQSDAAKYAGNKEKNDVIDGILCKHWNRKTKQTLQECGRVANEAYAEKYGSTLNRLKRKIEARKNKCEQV